jgi:hypothetical protein
MAHAADGRGIYRQLAQFGRERQDVIAGCWLGREQGALGAGSLSTREERAGPGGTGARKSTRWNGCSPPVK